MRRWLFVYGRLGVGGIETLIVRLTNHLARHGDEVAVLVSGGELLPLLGPEVNSIVYAERRSAIKEGADWLNRNPGEATIVSFDPISAALALSIENSVPRSVQHISGVYHPRAYFMESERRDRKVLNKLVSKAVGPECLYFMNDECRRSHARQWSINLSASPLIPLPLIERASGWSRIEGESPIRIVSVGRLTDFKKYNLGAPSVLKGLLAAGINATWDIYGDGELKSSVQNEIDAQGMQGKVRLCGNLPYEQLEAKLLGYDLFVGMGTAAAEAAMLGVPTIAAVVDSELQTYGWFHELPFGNVGERQEGDPPHLIENLIKAYLKLDTRERRDHSLALHQAAMKYALPAVAKTLIALAHTRPARPSRMAKQGVASLYAALTDGFVIRAARRLAG